ncbi:glycosyltransferase [Aquipuribacter nitratireducens]|uniref:Glycosyltransferase n=1 Tax=Aquipuribacter nitratireducens TaxID=650104 RepID=A0ABW0GK66_9MICO
MTGPVFRNDWRSLRPPELGRWTPRRTVSVVVPAYDCADTLPLTLAALSEQSYPQDLLEVLVVDDGGAVPVRLAGPRPAGTRVVATDPRHGWGSAAARQTGAEHATGEVVLWLDSDMLPFREHVEAQVRWHEVADDVVTLGYKRFVDAPLATPAEVVRRVRAGQEEALVDASVPRLPHDWIEAIVDRTCGLAEAGWDAFRVLVGATASVRADLLAASGGLDVSLKLAEDSEAGYRLYNQGAVFVPEPRAAAFHLGPSTVMTTKERVIAYNRPHVAQRMPLPRFRRRAQGPLWDVPVVAVGVDVTAHCIDPSGVDALVATLLAVAGGPLHDFQVRLAGPWRTLDEGRWSPLRDDRMPFRLVREYVRADPRFVLVDGPDAMAGTDPAVPFVTRLPAGARLGPQALERVVDTMVRTDLGLLAATVGGAVDPGLRVHRVAALNRARRLSGSATPGDDVVSAVSGGRWFRGEDLDVHAVDVPVSA